MTSWQTSKLKRDFWKRLEPPPDLKISEWSDEYRYLSKESAAEPGKFHVSRTPYMREIVDSVWDSDIAETWFRKSAQLGYSESGNNILAYYMHQDPCPMIMVQPTVDLAEGYSKERISPMLRDTPVLSQLVDDRSRVSGNTILKKSYPGGYLVMVGANSPRTAQSRPIRGIFFDEIDQYPYDVAGQGNIIDIFKMRQTTFWNRWVFGGGTPTIKGLSRIDNGFKRGDQRYYYVPCPCCGSHIVLRPEMQVRDPDNEHYSEFQCSECDGYIHEGHKLDMIKDSLLGGTAHWKATKPFKGIASFHLWAAYSPWKDWKEIADEYNEKKDSQLEYKSFKNLVEGESYEESGEKPESDKLMARREDYHPSGIPDDVVVITAGVDSQGDRLELEVVGWGVGEESWSLDYKVIHGEPLQSQVWEDLDEYLKSTTFTRRDGTQLKIKACLIDSGGKGSKADGHVSDRVYKFAKGKMYRNIFACKGASTYGQPVVARVSKIKKAGIKLVMVGTDTAKDLIYERLELTGSGEGRCHFPLSYEIKYFEMLTAEEKMIEVVGGRTTVRWKLGEREDGTKKKRNEALDCRVYALAALRLLPTNLLAMAKRMKLKARKNEKTKSDEPEPEEKQEEVTQSEPRKPARKTAKKKPRNPRRKRGGGWGVGAY